jgi:ribosomal protein S7
MLVVKHDCRNLALTSLVTVLVLFSYAIKKKDEIERVAKANR